MSSDETNEVTEAKAEEQVATSIEPPAVFPELVRQHYDAIREKEREVDALESEYLSLKEQASEAKKEFEAADKSLRRFIARGSDPQRELPFDSHAEPPAPVVEAWRSAPFTELGLTLKQNDLFESIGVTTIGAIEDLRASIAEGKAEWPKGIGPAKVTDIENRIIDWLDKNRDKFGEDATALTGVCSVTLSSPGRESVTLTSDAMEKLASVVEQSGVV